MQEIVVPVELKGIVVNREPVVLPPLGSGPDVTTFTQSQRIEYVALRRVADVVLFDATFGGGQDEKLCGRLADKIDAVASFEDLEGVVTEIFGRNGLFGLRDRVRGRVLTSRPSLDPWNHGFAIWERVGAWVSNVEERKIVYGDPKREKGQVTRPATFGLIEQATVNMDEMDFQGREALRRALDSVGALDSIGVALVSEFGVCVTRRIVDRVKLSADENVRMNPGDRVARRALKWANEQEEKLAHMWDARPAWSRVENRGPGKVRRDKRLQNK